MRLPKDLRECIESLNSSEVEYVIVGAVALAFHGFPRYTGDIDLLVRASPENAQRIASALARFGFASAGLSAADFLERDRVIQLGVAPNRVDLLTSLTGVEFEDAWQNRVPAVLDGLKVAFIDRASLVKNKKATGRAQDRADLEALGEE
ncbi:MAG: DUF6036 family nucleotidyltransferase [Bryobacteraceae bacterium]